jgi:hypothetical protein
MRFRSNQYVTLMINGQGEELCPQSCYLIAIPCVLVDMYDGFLKNGIHRYITASIGLCFGKFSFLVVCPDFTTICCLKIVPTVYVCLRINLVRVLYLYEWLKYSF